MFKPTLVESINRETRSCDGGLLTKGYYFYINECFWFPRYTYQRRANIKKLLHGGYGSASSHIYSEIPQELHKAALMLVHLLSNFNLLSLEIRISCEISHSGIAEFKRIFPLSSCSVHFRE